MIKAKNFYEYAFRELRRPGERIYHGIKVT
jgi:hypothetical protein